MEGSLYINSSKKQTSTIEELKSSHLDHKPLQELNSYSTFIACNINYWTAYLGEKILASGVVYIPSFPFAPLSIISYQHETLLLKKEAPSIARVNLIPELLASQGFIVLVPDYIGYGISEKLFHPYYDKTHSALCVTDFIKAATSFLHDEDIEIDGKLFLLGFSEGGYVTLAVQQSLEENPFKTLKLCAVAACAGGYDLIQLLSSLVSEGNNQVKTSYIVFLLLAYNRIYGKNRPLSYYFRGKYVIVIDKLFNGQYAEDIIEKTLTDNLKSLFTQRFYNELVGDGELDLKQALYFNSLSNNKPITPLRLYHGADDRVIPFKNTEVTFNNFIKNNSTVVSLIPLHNTDHSNSVFHMIGPCVKWFKIF